LRNAHEGVDGRATFGICVRAMFEEFVDESGIRTFRTGGPVERSKLVHEVGLVRIRAALEEKFCDLGLVIPCGLGECTAETFGGIDVGAGIEEEAGHRVVTAESGPHERGTSPTPDGRSLAAANVGVHIGAAFNEKADGIEFATGGGGHERGRAETVGGIDFRAMFEKEFDGFGGTAGARGDEKRCVAEGGTDVDVRAVLEEKFDFVVIASSAKKRSGAGVVGGVRICATVEEEFYGVGIAVKDGMRSELPARSR
jgi:hypothetical protein